MPPTKKKPLPDNVINPFSDDFLPHWDNWKTYRWEEHKFKYKGVMSEQAALMLLNDVSGQNEETAIEILKQSMANGWKGFFEIKNKINGTGKTQSTNGFSRQGVNSAFNSRYGKG